MRKFIWVVLIGLALFAVACSNDAGQNESTADYDMETEGNGGSDHFSGARNESSAQDTGESASPSENPTSGDILPPEDRKIIYTAHLDIEVTNFQESVQQIQGEVSKRGGYVVESNQYGGQGEDNTSGQITVRIPQEEFNDFIQLVEDGSKKVIESSISGQDVTEEYVDLESRLKSKRVVEERLLSFMEEAEKTEDLLKISNDLAKVQEEIEEITGRMKYLDNKSDLATVTIRIQEKNVTISSMNDDELNTWERTKEQLMKSINMLVSFFSFLIVAIIGNLPVFLILAVIGFVTYWMFKKRKNTIKKE